MAHPLSIRFRSVIRSHIVLPSTSVCPPIRFRWLCFRVAPMSNRHRVRPQRNRNTNPPPPMGTRFAWIEPNKPRQRRNRERTNRNLPFARSLHIERKKSLSRPLPISQRTLAGWKNCICKAFLYLKRVDKIAFGVFRKAKSTKIARVTMSLAKKAKKI